MTQEFNDPELFSDFIVEAKEHLETIEPNLLELEKNPANLGLLNEIFRPMHSLKGASGFLGLNAINGLAHKAENILDELRKGKIAATAEIMDMILSATDALRTMIDSLESAGTEGDVDTGPIIVHIEALLAGTAMPQASAAPCPAPDDASPAEPGPAAEPESMVGEAGEGRGFYMPELTESGPPYGLQAIGEGHLTDFLEEAREIIANLNASLLELEKDPTVTGELVNDIFRYFHNLKGNSGIIGHKELNGLTHEAETLLNKVRKGEMSVTRPMIDLLLSTVDMMESLTNRIDSKTNQATPLDIVFLVEKLRQAAETGDVTPTPRPAALKAEAAPAKEQACSPAAAQDSDMDPEDVDIFMATVTQQFENIHYALNGLEKEPENKDLIDGLFRSLDSLRNSAGYMGFSDLKLYAERTAGMVDQARKSGLSFDLMLDILRQECSILEDMVHKVLEGLPRSAAQPAADGSALEERPATESASPAPAPEPEPVPEAVSPPAAKPEAKPQPAPVKAAAQPAPAPAAAPQAGPAPAAQAPAAQGAAKVSSTIRVDHEKLDHLMNLIGELIINRNRYSLLARSLEEGKIKVQDIAQQLTETTYAMARISDDLQDTIMKVRMVPVSSVFSRFPRLVRDLSRKSGKEVELITEGEETELDKSVVEVIGDPLVHLIRNSVDHGLEPEDKRLAAGKPSTGRVWLRAYHRGNSVAIEVEDDGKGIDPATMREVAVRKGVISAEEAKVLDDRDAMELIFMPGFSSAEKITDISGRGVGMDVVRTNIKNLKGTVSVTSEVGKGSKFTLTLPLTLAIIDALMVMVGNQTYAIPLDAVSETTKLEVKRMTEVNKRKAVTLRGEVLGIIELREVLDIAPDNDGPKEIASVVILHDNERRLGVVVDKLLERQEIVIKPLGTYLSEFDMRGISGATIMGDGSVVLILDPHEIYLMSTVQQRAGTF